MIHIEETILDPNTITIKLEGVLDLTAVPVIQGVFERCLKRQLAVHLDLGGLTHITREGRKYLNGIRQNVSLKHLPKFMTLDNGTRQGSN
jgi:anti-anti-sigma regulatory factor